MPGFDYERRFGTCLPDIRSMGFMAFDPIWAQKDHPASGLEVLHVIKGTVQLTVAGSRFTAGPGETLLVPPGAPHRDEFDLEEGLELFFCTLLWPLAEDYFAIVDNRALTAMHSHRKAEVATLFDQLRADLAGAAPVDKLVARARLHTILLLVLREAVHQSQANLASVEETPYGMERRRALMLQAKAYLERHYADGIALDDIAAELHVSAYYLSHLFSEQSGFSLFSYLTSLRMEKAQGLLLEGQLNVAEVGRAVGYEDANYFSKAFKKHVGSSPREFAAAGLKTRRK